MGIPAIILAALAIKYRRESREIIEFLKKHFPQPARKEEQFVLETPQRRQAALFYRE